MLAYHFVGSSLRDGRPVPADGEKLVHSGELELCSSGLHASENILDALRYAPGFTLCRVECGGEIIEGDDKLVCSERTILWRRDVKNILLSFARECASEVLHLWNAPESVKSFLATGEGADADAAADADADAAADAAAAAAAAADAAAAAAYAAAAAAAAYAAAAAAYAAAAAAYAAAARADWNETYDLILAKYESRLKTLIEEN